MLSIFNPQQWYSQYNEVNGQAGLPTSLGGIGVRPVKGEFSAQPMVTYITRVKRGKRCVKRGQNLSFLTPEAYFKGEETLKA